MEELDFGKVIELINKQGLEATLKELGITEEQLREEGGYPIEQILDGKEGVNSSMNEDFVPDYTKTAEYEGAGITADLTPADSLVGAGVEEVMAYGEANGWNPALLGILAAISTKGKSLKKTPKLKDEGMLSLPKKNLDEGFGSVKRLENAAHRRGKTFTPKMTKGGKPYKDNPHRTAKSGEVVGKPTKGGPGVAVGKPSSPSQVPSKHVKYPIATKTGNGTKIGLTDKNKWRAGAGIATGIATGIGLYGLRGDDGSLEVAPDDTPTLPPIEVSPPEAEGQGNQFGYHKQEGQNFWTVDNDDPYWDTHEIGTGDAFTDSELKGEEMPELELDWSGWFTK